MKILPPFRLPSYDTSYFLENTIPEVCERLCFPVKKNEQIKAIWILKRILKPKNEAYWPIVQQLEVNEEISGAQLKLA